MSYAIREPSLHATPILDLKPTQMTLGMAEVARKRQAWRAHHPDKLAEFLAYHMAPVVVGPGERRYLIDHHHLARALYDEGVKSVFVVIVAGPREPGARGNEQRGRAGGQQRALQPLGC